MFDVVCMCIRLSNYHSFFFKNSRRYFLVLICLFFAHYADIVRWNLKSLEHAMCMGLRNSNFSYWNEVRGRIMNSVNTASNLKLRKALACPLDKEILKSHLNACWLPDSPISFLEAIAALLNENDNGVDAILDFMEDMAQISKL